MFAQSMWINAFVLFTCVALNAVSALPITVSNTLACLVSNRVLTNSNIANSCNCLVRPIDNSRIVNLQGVNQTTAYFICNTIFGSSKIRDQRITKLW